MAQLTKNKKPKDMIQINRISVEQGNITTDTSETQSTVKEYFKQPVLHQVRNTERRESTHVVHISESKTLTHNFFN